MDAFDIRQFAHDLLSARREKTLEDLTEEQWARVCNRIANALHQQMSIDWDEFMVGCGLEAPNQCYGLLEQRYSFVDERCPECGAELSTCGQMTADGPSMECLVCQQRDVIAALRTELEIANSR